MPEEYEKDNNSLLYRPDLKPERNYRSEAEFEPYKSGIQGVDPRTVPVVENEVDHSPAAILEKLEAVKDAFIILPKELHYLADDIVQKLIDRLKIITPTGTPVYSDIPKEKYTPKTEPTTNTTFIEDIPWEENEELAEVPSLFPETIPINLTLEEPKTLVQLAQSDYEKDQLKLDEFYALKVQLIMQQYVQKMIMSTTDCGAGDIDQLMEDFDGDAVKIPSGKNLEHCRDFIIRSQMARKQKNMMLKKTHNADETLTHLRAWQAAAQQRKRYYDEQYGDSGSFTESHSNALLRAQRKMYDEAYKDATYNMYKYLNSSALLMNDILEDTAKEGQAKGMLLKNNVNIFESSETKMGAEGLAAEEKEKAAATAEEKATEPTEEEKKKAEEDAKYAASDKEDEFHSHGKGANGKYYSNNDWDYLKSSGNYSDDEIKKILDESDKYKKEDSTDSTKTDSGSNTKVEDVADKKEPFISIDKDVLNDAAENLTMNLADGITEKINNILR